MCRNLNGSRKNVNLVALYSMREGHQIRILSTKGNARERQGEVGGIWRTPSLILNSEIDKGVAIEDTRRLLPIRLPNPDLRQEIAESSNTRAKVYRQE